MRSLSQEEKEIIFMSLVVRKNLIETGHPSLSREDAIQQKLKLRPLDQDQTNLVSKIK